MTRLPDLGGDRFVLKERIGAGGFGAVYRAHDTVQHGDVALKTMHGADPVTMWRLKREFRSLAGIVHPNLVTLYHLFAGDDAFFTMELVEGVHFLRYVRSQAAPDTPASELPTPAAVPQPRPSRGASRGTSVLDAGRLRAALPQLVAAIQALHQGGKLHRDIKSSNVLVRPDGRVAVCDFGLVVETHAGRGGNAGKSGTPSAMSPEQIAGRPFGEAADWYAVGALLYEALTGVPPFQGEIDDILRAKLTITPGRPDAIDPSVPADLADLAMALLAVDPAARPTGPALLASLGAAPMTATQPAPAAFIGRGRELAALADALQASRRGRSVTVLVHGPSGIGKTSLCRRFLERATRDGALVLEGRCYERESVPYKALDAIVDSLTQHLARLPPRDVARLVTADHAALARVFPALQRIPILEAHRRTTDPPLDPQRLRASAFAALRDLLASLGRDSPTILFIDDLHWGDRDSAAFLIDLVHRSVTMPVLLVASYRTEDEASSPLLQALLAPPAVRAGDLRRLAVAPLGARDGEDLATAILGDDAEARAIVAEASGHPFFISVLADAHASGAAPSERGVSLDDVIRARIARLPDGARALLGAAAVAGVPTPLEVLRRAAEVADLPAAMTAMRGQSLVRTRMIGDSEHLEPYHDRIRVVAAATLSADDARRVHRRLARALELRGGDAIALVEHWLAAGDRLRAAIHATRAAQHAERALAFARAAHYHGVVLELGALTDESRRIVERHRAVAFADAGNLGDAARGFLAAADGAEPGLALELRRRAVELLLRSGELDAGLALAVELAREVGLAMPTDRRRMIASLLARRAWSGLRGLRVRTLPVEQRDPAVLRRIDVCDSLAAGLSFVDPMVGAWFQSRRLQDALRAGDPQRAATALALETGFRHASGASGRVAAERAATASEALAQRLGDTGLLGWIAAGRALGAFLRGEFESARELLIASEPLMSADPGRFRWQLDLAQVYRAGTLWYLGRLRELCNLLPLLLREAVEQGDVYLANALGAWRSNVVWLISDDPQEARRRLAAAAPTRTLTTRFHLHHYYQLLGHAQIELYEGAGTAAWERLEAAWPSIEGSTLLRMQMMRIEAHFLRARCAVAAGGEEHLLDAEHCAAKIEKERRPFGDALASLIHAAVSAQRKEDAAVGRFEHAYAACKSAGMRHYAMAARWRLGELLGGTRGGEELRGAVAWLAAEEVVGPERLVAMLCPV